MRHVLNEPLVIADVLDGEAIVLHMQTGRYFSMKGSALVIWHCLSNGLTCAETVDRLKTRYPEAALQVENAVDGMLGQFLAEDLLRVSEAQVDDTAFEVPDVVGDFGNPTLETYTDMQDLLLIDPIHEVEETGWPHKKVD